MSRLRSAEVNTVSGVLKLYFRELPESLVPPDLFQSLAKTLGKTNTSQTRHVHISETDLEDFKVINSEVVV